MALRVAPTTIPSMAFRSFRFFFHAKREEREREREVSRESSSLSSFLTSNVYG